jgi:hypothetical protein
VYGGHGEAVYGRACNDFFRQETQSTWHHPDVLSQFPQAHARFYAGGSASLYVLSALYTPYTPSEALFSLTANAATHSTL